MFYDVYACVMAYLPLDERLFRVDGEVPVLLGSRCTGCNESFFPRRRLCPICLRPTQEVDLPRRGALYSYTYVHVPFFGRRRVDSGGYGVGQVDLPGGPRIQTVLAGEPGSWRIGMPMTIDLDVVEQRDGDDVVIFRFRPDEGVAHA